MVGAVYLLILRNLDLQYHPTVKKSTSAQLMYAGAGI